MIVEVCVDSLEGALAAEEGGADRVELCSSLGEGGITPSHGLVTAVCRALTRCRVHVLIRPRPGDFLYSPQELQASQTDAQPLAHAQPCNRSPPCVRELCRRSREPQAAGGDVQHLSLLCSHALGSVLTARPPSPPNSAEPPCQQVMRSDVLHAASCGAHGVVLGMLTPGGEADVHALRPFVELCAALGLDLTFHRAFDLVKDQRKVLDDLVACRVRRVLSSGGQQSVMEGLQQLAELVAQGGSRISVMPGGGVDAENAATVARVTGCSEVHGTFKRSVPSSMQYRHASVSFGKDDWSRMVTDAAAVARVRQQLGQPDGSME